MSQGQTFGKMAIAWLRVGLRNLEARESDVSFNQEVNWKPSISEIALCTWLVEKNISQAQRAIITGVPLAMIYLGLSGGRMAGLPGGTHRGAHRHWSSRRWKHLRLWGHFGVGVNLHNLMLWIWSCTHSVITSGSNLDLRVGCFWSYFKLPGSHHCSVWDIWYLSSPVSYYLSWKHVMPIS